MTQSALVSEFNSWDLILALALISLWSWTGQLNSDFWYPILEQTFDARQKILRLERVSSESNSILTLNPASKY